MYLPRRIAAVAFALALCACGSDQPMEVEVSTPSTIVRSPTPTAKEKSDALRYLQQVMFMEEWHRQLVAGAKYAAGVERDLARRTAAATRRPLPQRAATRPRPAVYNGGGSPFDRIAQCESGGDWSANTGNGYYGGIQFTLSSWHAVGGTGYPHEHSREEQIAAGWRLQAIQGWGAWPVCSHVAGLR